MASSNLPQELRQFIHRDLPSMEHVDLLLYLMRVAPSGRSEAEIGVEAKIPAASVKTRIADLVASGLVAFNDEANVRRYRYEPVGLRQRVDAEMLMQAYNTRPVSLIREVYERPLGAAEQFANAFRWRKRESDG